MYGEEVRLEKEKGKEKEKSAFARPVLKGDDLRLLFLEF